MSFTYYTYMAYSFVLIRKQHRPESSALMNKTACSHYYERVVQSKESMWFVSQQVSTEKFYDSCAPKKVYWRL